MVCCDLYSGCAVSKNLLFVQWLFASVAEIKKKHWKTEWFSDLAGVCASNPQQKLLSMGNVSNVFIRSPSAQEMSRSYFSITSIWPAWGTHPLLMRLPSDRRRVSMATIVPVNGWTKTRSRTFVSRPWPSGGANNTAESGRQPDWWLLKGCPDVPRRASGISRIHNSRSMSVTYVSGCQPLVGAATERDTSLSA